MLSEGKAPKLIGARFQIIGPTLRVHFSHIRAKTGLQDLGNRALLRKAIEHYDSNKPVTEAQWKVLRLRSQGMSYKDIGEELKIDEQTAMNQAWAGRNRLGINARGLPGMKELRYWVKKHDSPLDDPAWT